MSFQYPSMIFALLVLGWGTTFIRWLQITKVTRQRFGELSAVSVCAPEQENPVLHVAAQALEHECRQQIELYVNANPADSRDLLETLSIPADACKKVLWSKNGAPINFDLADGDMEGILQANRIAVRLKRNKEFHIWAETQTKSGFKEGTEEKALHATGLLTWKEQCYMIFRDSTLLTVYGPIVWAWFMLGLGFAWRYYFGPLLDEPPLTPWWVRHLWWPW